MTLYRKVTNPMHDELHVAIAAISNRFEHDGMPRIEVIAVLCQIVGQVIATLPNDFSVSAGDFVLRNVKAGNEAVISAVRSKK